MNSEDDPAGVPLPDRYVALAASAVEDVLASQRGDGSFPSPGDVKPFAPHAQNGLCALAYLWRTEHPHNPFARDRRLLEAVVRNGDLLADSADEAGRFHYDSRGYDVHGVDQWLSSAWLEALLLVEGELGAGRAGRWRERLHAGAGTLMEELRAWNALEGPYHTRSFGTSPNHAVTRAAFLHRAGTVFEEPEWCSAADAFMPRFLALQDVDGCWPEYEGPVITYAMVSLTGVGQYYEYTGDEAARRAVERTIPFIARAHYPDGGPIALLDGRQQHTAAGTAWGHFALSLTDEGRAVCDLLTRTAPGGKHLTGMALYRTVENYRCYHDGPVGRLPMHQTSFTHRFRRTAGVRKAGAWMWALSGIVTPSFPTSPWSLERQSLLSLYHTSAGRILSGANCKEHPEAATFASRAVPHDCLPKSTSLDDDVTHLDAVYDTFRGMLTVRAVSDAVFEVRAEVRDGVAGVRLQPAVHYGGMVRVDGVERRLADDDWALDDVRTLTWENVTLSFDVPARVWWPFRGYNSYSADHTYSELTSARLVVGLSVTAGDAVRRVEVSVAT